MHGRVSRQKLPYVSQLLWGDNRQAQRQRLPAYPRTLRNLRVRACVGTHHFLTLNTYADNQQNRFSGKAPVCRADVCPVGAALTGNRRLDL
jgi:hypothetical protein